ncbi:MAG: IclR family transcriptional regulator [Alphaproteobacteria bacterium]|nr:MAG: IclR family transcriptional regulator [Alphaproteobacteria bacterium]
MKTVDKALAVLDQFSLEHTELGLSELARMAGLDKAATRRLLLALARHGFIEQVAQTRKYRLGQGFLRLARIREATVPLARAAQEVTDWLVEQTAETAHVSIPGRMGMTTVAHRMPNRGHVVNVDPAELLPFHATASGLAWLAFSGPQTVEAVLAQPRAKITAATVTSPAELRSMLARFRAQGYAQTRDSFEAGVSSLAMPFFRDAPEPAGTIALALPTGDLTESRRDALLPLLREAVARLQSALTGL